MQCTDIEKGLMYDPVLVQGRMTTGHLQSMDQQPNIGVQKSFIVRRETVILQL